MQWKLLLTRSYTCRLWLTVRFPAVTTDRSDAELVESAWSQAMDDAYFGFAAAVGIEYCEGILWQPLQLKIVIVCPVWGTQPSD